MTRNKLWTPLNRSIVFHYAKFDLVEYSFKLSDNRVIDDYYVIEENDVGSVVAITPQGEIVLVQQYKAGIQQLCIEIPAGLFEDGEDDPVAESLREFVEETGYAAEKYHFIGSLPQSPSRLNNQVHVVLAQDAFKKTDQQLDPNESIDILLLPVDVVLHKIRNGEINAMGTVAGIFLALDFLKSNPELHTYPIQEWL